MSGALGVVVLSNVWVHFRDIAPGLHRHDKQQLGWRFGVVALLLFQRGSELSSSALRLADAAVLPRDVPPLASFAYWAELLNLILKVMTLADPVAEVLGKESSGLLSACKDRLTVPGHPDSFRRLWECLHHR